MTSSRFWISGVIFIFLFLQGIATFGVYSPGLWPFLDYPMYRRAHYEGDEVPQYEVVGILQDGSSIAILEGDLGLNFWLYMDGPVEALLNEDVQKARFYAQIYEERSRHKLIGLQLMKKGVKVFKEGPRSIPPHIVKSLTLEEEETP